MAKELDVTCNFARKQLVCNLLGGVLEVMVKIRTKYGEHTFKEDVYTRSQKYKMWDDQERPFGSLRRRVASIFRRE